MDEIERLKSENAGWSRACELADEKVAEMKAALKLTYNSLTELLDTLDQEQGLSDLIIESINRADLSLSNWSLRLLD